MRRFLIGVIALAGCHKVFGLERDPDGPLAVDAPSAYAQAVIDDVPAAYLRLDEATGIDCADVVVNGPAGMALGGVTRGVPGAIVADMNAAVGFDGMNGAVSLGDVLDFEGTQPFTLEAWIKPTFTGHFQEVMSKWTQPPSRAGWTLYIFDARVGFERDTSSTVTSLVEYTGLQEGVYNHLVATFDGTAMTIFVDGVQRNTKIAPVVTPKVPVPMLIGAANGNPGNAPFAGAIDEVALYERALTPARVNEHYRLGIAP